MGKSLNVERSDLSFRKLIVAALWRMNWEGQAEMRALGGCCSKCTCSESKLKPGHLGDTQELEWKEFGEHLG